ncbi:8346_t:CDS:2, partial [Funneliformis geosporum]
SLAIKRLKPALEQLLESNSTNLADCFIQLINLASLLSKLPSDNMVAFQQYAIKYFNNRWKGFDSDLYILSYFLHPAYRGQGLKKGNYTKIANKAAKIWQNEGNDWNSCKILLAQMRKYKLYRELYNKEYELSYDIPE